MSELPSEERLAELREMATFNGRAHVPRPELLALLDCALAVRRLEQWIQGGTEDDPNSVTIDSDGIGANVSITSKLRPFHHWCRGYTLTVALTAALDAAEAPRG